MFNLQLSGLIINYLEVFREKEISRLSMLISNIEEGNETYQTFADMIDRIKNSDYEQLITRTIIDATLWSDEKSKSYATKIKL